MLLAAYLQYLREKNKSLYLIIECFYPLLTVVSPQFLKGKRYPGAKEEGTLREGREMRALGDVLSGLFLSVTFLSHSKLEGR